MSVMLKDVHASECTDTLESQPLRIIVLSLYTTYMLERCDARYFGLLCYVLKLFILLN